jgi:hypothetical protein
MLIKWQMRDPSKVKDWHQGTYVLKFSLLTALCGEEYGEY